jgi:formamidopyrimidine-DNA glycosylase
LCDLDSGDEMMIHLRMSGRVLVEPTGTKRPAHTHVVMSLSERDGMSDEMWFVDPRTFGEVVVFDPLHTAQVLPELIRLGVDPICEHFDATVLAQRLEGKRGAIKPLLLSQHVVAGIGNIYADEILHRAGLRWNRSADSLTKPQVRSLAQHIFEVLSDAIAAGGSTLDDSQYVDIEGKTGSFQAEHRVYGRDGKRCVTCGKADIVRVVAAGRATAYCPRCQK